MHDFVPIFRTFPSQMHTIYRACILGFDFITFGSHEIAVERMLATVMGIEGLEYGDAIMKTKEKVYKRISMGPSRIGYPSDVNAI